MTITYTLKFEQFDTLDQFDGMSDVIRTVHYRVTATDDGSPEIQEESYGTVRLDYPQVGTFIPRASVTVDDVKSWFLAVLDPHVDGSPMPYLIDDIKAALAERIAKKRNPTSHVDDPDQTFKDGVSV